MRRIEAEMPWNIRSFNSCQHKGKLLSLSMDAKKLCVMVFGLTCDLRLLDVSSSWESHRAKVFTCGSLGSAVILLGTAYNIASHHYEPVAALLSLDDDALKATSIQSVQLTVNGIEASLTSQPFLSPVSETQMFVTFSGNPDVYFCELEKSSLCLHCRAIHHLHAPGGAFATSLCLPGVGLLTVGGKPPSREIGLLRWTTHGLQVTWEKIGDLPGEARSLTSAILLGERFLVGFGGIGEARLDDLWIFDVQTRKGSPVAKKGEWHPPSYGVSLLAQGDAIFLVGGRKTATTHCLPVNALSKLITDKRLRSAFCRWLDPLALPSVDWIPEASRFSVFPWL